MKLILRQEKFKIKSPESCKFIQMWKSWKSLSRKKYRNYGFYGGL